MTPRILPLLVVSGLVGCAAPAASRSYDLPSDSLVSASQPSQNQGAPTYVPGGTVPPPGVPPPAVPQRMAPEWRKGQSLMQGYFGVSYYDNVTVEGSGPGHVDGDKGDLDQLPVFGGGAQWKLGGERIDYGLECLFDFSWRSNATAFVVGGGGATVAVDVSMLIWEIYGGPFVSVFLGDNIRLYAAAGPVMQWAQYDQYGVATDHGSGFGTGLYARTGIEFVLPSRTMFGFGARWSDTRTDLSGNVGDLQMDGLQILLTVTRGF